MYRIYRTLRLAVTLPLALAGTILVGWLVAFIVIWGYLNNRKWKR